MELSDKHEPRRIVVGLLLGAHGVRGDVRVRSFTADPDALFDYGPLTDPLGQVLLEARTVRTAKDHFIVTPVTPRQKEDWDALKGTQLCVPRVALGEADEDEFFVEDLVGLDVFTGGEAPVGRVKAVQDFGAGDLLEVEPVGGGKTVFVPFTREDVPAVDLALGRVIVAAFETWSDEAGEREEER